MEIWIIGNWSLTTEISNDANVSFTTETSRHLKYLSKGISRKSFSNHLKVFLLLILKHMN